MKDFNLNKYLINIPESISISYNSMEQILTFSNNTKQCININLNNIPKIEHIIFVKTISKLYIFSLNEILLFDSTLYTTNHFKNYTYIDHNNNEIPNPINLIKNNIVLPNKVINQNLIQKSYKIPKNYKAYVSTLRSLINSSILGLKNMYIKKLKLVGIGFKVQHIKEKNVLLLNLACSHDYYYAIPKNIEISIIKNTQIIIQGFDKQEVSQVAAQIRAYRKPDVYKGKGILYDNEYIKLKEGKQK